MMAAFFVALFAVCSLSLCASPPVFARPAGSLKVKENSTRTAAQTMKIEMDKP
jgi:hypothetical protein